MWTKDQQAPLRNDVDTLTATTGLGTEALFPPIWIGYLTKCSNAAANSPSYHIVENFLNGLLKSFFDLKTTPKNGSRCLRT